MGIKQTILCLFGMHDWLVIDGSRKKTGYVVGQLFVPLHELQEDNICSCCGMHRTRFGLLKPYGVTELPGGVKFEYAADGWPIDDKGNRMTHRPGYSYTSAKKPEYHGRVKQGAISKIPTIRTFGAIR